MAIIDTASASIEHFTRIKETIFGYDNPFNYASLVTYDKIEEQGHFTRSQQEFLDLLNLLMNCSECTTQEKEDQANFLHGIFSVVSYLSIRFNNTKFFDVEMYADGEVFGGRVSPLFGLFDTHPELLCEIESNGLLMLSAEQLKSCIDVAPHSVKNYLLGVAHALASSKYRDKNETWVKVIQN